jgi:hypothetical protein
MSCCWAAPAVPLVAVEGFWKVPIAIAHMILELRAASIVRDLFFFF